MTPLFLLVALAHGAPVASPEPPTFRVAVETVSVDVAVTRKGLPVTDLTAADFDVRDDGVPQSITLASLERLPLCVILVLDASGSVRGKVQDLRGAASAVLHGLRDGDQAALLTFSQRITRLSPPTSNLASVESALERIAPEGNSAVFDALYAGLALPVPGYRPLVVLFTDGEDNMSFFGPADVQSVANEVNTLADVVAITPSGTASTNPALSGEGSGIGALGRVAESTGGRILWADSSARLRDTFQQALAEMRTRYVLQFDLQGVPREGLHRLDVRVRGRGLDVRARRSYSVRQRHGSR